MMRLRRWGLAIGCLLGLAGPAPASPTVQYNFTGILDRPVDGTTQFSGSFTIPTDLLPSAGPSYGFSIGERVGMSIQIGDHAASIYHANYGDPTIDGNTWIGHNLGAPYQPGDVVNLWTSTTQNQADPATLGARLGLGIYLAQPAGTALPETWPDILTNLDLSKFSTRSFVLNGSYSDADLAPTGGIAGTLTSLTRDGDPVVILPPSPPATPVADPTPTPEPSTLALAGLVGLGWLARRGGRRRSA